MKQPCAVNLHNVVTVGRRSASAGAWHSSTSGEMREVCDALGFALGCGG